MLIGYSELEINIQRRVAVSSSKILFEAKNCGMYLMNNFLAFEYIFYINQKQVAETETYCWLTWYFSKWYTSVLHYRSYQ